MIRGNQVPSDRLLLSADEVPRVVRTAIAPVCRRLRIGTQRPRPHNFPVLDARRGHFVWSLAAFDPAPHDTEHVERVRARTAIAFAHAWDHVQANPPFRVPDPN